MIRQYKREISEIIRFVENFYFFANIGQFAETFNNGRKLAEAVCKFYLYYKNGTPNNNIQTSIIIGKDKQDNDIYLNINGIDYIFAPHNKPSKNLQFERLKHITKSLYSDYSIKLEEHLVNLQEAGNLDSHSSGGRHNSTIDDFQKNTIHVKHLISWLFEVLLDINIPQELKDVFNGKPVDIAKRYNKYKQLEEEQLTVLTKIEDKKLQLTESELLRDVELNSLKYKLVELTAELDFFKEQTNNIFAQIKDGNYDTSNINISKAIKFLTEYNDIDMAIKSLDDDLFESEEIKISNKRLFKANLFLLKQDFKNAISNFEKSIAIHKNRRNLSEFADFLTLKEIDFDRGINLYREMLELDNSVEQSIILKCNIGGNYVITEQYNKAENYYKSAYSDAIEVKDSNGLFTSINGLCGLYFVIEKFDEAIKYGKQGVEVLNENNSSKSNDRYINELVIIKNTIAHICLETQKNEDAEKLFKETIELIKTTNLQNEPKSILSDLYVLQSNNLASFFNNRKRYDEAVEIYNDAISTQEQLFKTDEFHYIELLASMYSRLAVIYHHELNLLDKAEYNYQKAYELNKKMILMPYKLNPDKKIRVLDYKLGLLNLQRKDFKTAYKYFVNALIWYQDRMDSDFEFLMDATKTMYHLAVTDLNLGNIQRAKIGVDKALSIMNQFQPEIQENQWYKITLELKKQIEK